MTSGHFWSHFFLLPFYKRYYFDFLILQTGSLIFFLLSFFFSVLCWYVDHIKYSPWRLWNGFWRSHWKQYNSWGPLTAWQMRSTKGQEERAGIASCSPVTVSMSWSIEPHWSYVCFSQWLPVLGYVQLAARLMSLWTNTTALLLLVGLPKGTGEGLY